MKCQKCGGEQPDNNCYCKYCGAALSISVPAAQEPAKRQFCDICGSKLRENAEFCAACGAAVEHAGQRPEAEQMHTGLPPAGWWKKPKNMVILAVCAAGLAAGLFFLARYAIVPRIKYDKAEALYEAGEYDAAMEAFRRLDGAFDSEERAEQIKKAERALEKAADHMQTGNIAAAAEIYANLGDYDDCSERLGEIIADYGKAVKLLEKGEYLAAEGAFKALHNYADSEARLAEAVRLAAYQEADKLYEGGNYKAALEAYAKLGGDVPPAAVEPRARDGVIRCYLAQMAECLRARDYDGFDELMGRMRAYNVPEEFEAELDALRRELGDARFAEARELLENGKHYEYLAFRPTLEALFDVMPGEPWVALDDMCHAGIYADMEKNAQEGKYEAVLEQCGYLPDNYEQVDSYREYCGLVMGRYLTAANEAELTRLADMGFLDAAELKKAYLDKTKKVEGEWWYTGSKTREGRVSDGTITKLTIGGGSVEARQYEIWRKGWNGRYFFGEVMELMDIEPDFVAEMEKKAPYTGMLAYDMEKKCPCILAEEKGSIALALSGDALFIDPDVFNGDVGDWRMYWGYYFSR